MRKMIEILERERELFSSLRDVIERQKSAMIERNLEEMNDALLESEKLILEIERLDEERHRLFEALKEEYGLPKNAKLEELLKRMEGDTREEFVDAVSRFLSTLNDLAISLDGMKSMMQFENAYFEFLVEMLSGGVKGATYDERGGYGRVERARALNVRW